MLFIEPKGNNNASQGGPNHAIKDLFPEHDSVCANKERTDHQWNNREVEPAVSRGIVGRTLQSLLHVLRRATSRNHCGPGDQMRGGRARQPVQSSSAALAQPPVRGRKAAPGQ